MFPSWLRIPLGITAVMLMLAAAAWLAISSAQKAGAGIGPAGFAQVAQEAITRENNSVYGRGNSPWNVKCTEKPDYNPLHLSDVVTCQITEKR